MIGKQGISNYLLKIKKMSRNSRLSKQDYFFAFFRLVTQPFFAASDFDNGFFFATVFFFVAFLDVAIFYKN
jgi:hypothetical protein